MNTASSITEHNVDRDHDYMTLALQLAEKGRYTVSPNPMVGCVIVKNHHIVGQGYHQQAGGAHAEIHALQAAGVAARDATVYVTLEPCCHTDKKTPPCVHALIAARVKKVVVACHDPNPFVAGRGLQALRDAGIEIDIGLLQAQAEQLNEIFFYYITHKRPFVIAKWAMSLDGKTITAPTDTRQISGHEAYQHTHQLRQQVDAVLIGANTARVDNPQLTARPHNATSSIKQPLRIILSTQKTLPTDLTIFDSNLPGKTLIATTQSESSFEKLSHIEIMSLPAGKNAQVNLPALLDELGKRGITSLLVEGGRQVHEHFFKENLVNKIHVYLAPVIIGVNEKKQTMTLQCDMLGNDFCFTGMMMS